MSIPQFKNLPFHSFPLQVKDIDAGKSQVVIYVSAFSNVDSDGDIIQRGAFAKTIKEQGPEGSKRIKQLNQHTFTEPVGRPLEMIEDEKGLLVTSQLSESTLAKDIIANYQTNLYEHSIGFQVIKQERDNERGITTITEIKLWEYSNVTWGANELTPLVGMKGIDHKVIVDMYAKRMDRLGTILTSTTDHTAEKLQEYSNELDYLKTFYNDIIALSQPSQDTHEPELLDALKGELTLLNLKQ